MQPAVVDLLARGAAVEVRVARQLGVGGGDVARLREDPGHRFLQPVEVVAQVAHVGGVGPLAEAGVRGGRLPVLERLGHVLPVARDRRLHELRDPGELVVRRAVVEVEAQQVPPQPAVGPRVLLPAVAAAPEVHEPPDAAARQALDDRVAELPRAALGPGAGVVRLGMPGRPGAPVEQVGGDRDVVRGQVVHLAGELLGEALCALAAAGTVDRAAAAVQGAERGVVHRVVAHAARIGREVLLLDARWRSRRGTGAPRASGGAPAGGEPGGQEDHGRTRTHTPHMRKVGRGGSRVFIPPSSRGKGRKESAILSLPGRPTA